MRLANLRAFATSSGCTGALPGDGTRVFVTPIPNTTPQLFVSAGARESIIELLTRASRLPAGLFDASTCREAKGPGPLVFVAVTVRKAGNGAGFGLVRC